MGAIQFINKHPEEFLHEISQLIDQKIHEHFKKFKMEHQEQILTQKEAAKFLRISKGTLIKWCKIGKIKSYKIGKQLRYKKSELLNTSL